MDLGCGYGIVSAWIISQYSATGQTKKIIIDAVDSSPLAIDLTTLNIKTLLGSSVRDITFQAIQSDVLTDKYFEGKEYDCIITNPPFSAGKKSVFAFISQSFNHLRPGGQLRLIAPTNKGAKSHITYTEEIFGVDNVEILALENGLRVWRATKA
jgi:16S rRNA (guanine1207-N2)-methyltransferase